MRISAIQGLSWLLGLFAIIFLLWSNIDRGSFFINDWIVVSVDLGVKLFVELYIIFKEKE